MYASDRHLYQTKCFKINGFSEFYENRKSYGSWKRKINGPVYKAVIRNELRSLYQLYTGVFNLVFMNKQ